jgi:hypothetical protein
MIAKRQADPAMPAEEGAYVERASERVVVVHETRALTGSGEVRAIVCDLSRHGVLCEIADRVDAGADLRIFLPVTGWVDCQARWTRDGRTGCEFGSPLNAASFYPALTEMLAERPAPIAGQAAHEVPSALLPLELLQVGRLNRVQTGAFARATADRTDAYFTGISGGRPVFVRHHDNGYFYADLADGVVEVAAVTGVRFLVDWSTARPIEQQERKNGALCLQRGAILICATPWNQRGRHLIELARLAPTEPSGANISFARWSAYVRHNGTDHMLWSEGAP